MHFLFNGTTSSAPNKNTLQFTSSRPSPSYLKSTKPVCLPPSMATRQWRFDVSLLQNLWLPPPGGVARLEPSSASTHAHVVARERRTELHRRRRKKKKQRRYPLRLALDGGSHIAGVPVQQPENHAGNSPRRGLPSEYRRGGDQSFFAKCIPPDTAGRGNRPVDLTQTPPASVQP